MKGVDIHISITSNILVVAFGGIAQQLSMPPFEFKNFLTNNFGDINFIFIRDMEQAWYFNGIRGLSENIEENIKGIKEIIKDIPANKIIFIGNSMGGYASILYGILLNIDNVLAFAPQTFIDKDTRKKTGDDRWKNQINKIHKKLSDHPYFNLNNLNDVENNTKVHLFYGNRSKLDVIHANNLKQNKNTSLFLEKNSSHGVIKDLKKSGKLKKIFNHIINE